MTDLAADLAAALETLAAEHAAIYVYGVLGAQTSAGAAPALFTVIGAAYADHRTRRDELEARITTLGGTPTASAAAYDVPESLGSSRAIGRAGVVVEERCAAAYAFLVGSSDGDLRRFGVQALTSAALRVLDLGGRPETFPGLPQAH